MNIVLHS